MTEDPYKGLKLNTGIVAKPGTTLINKTGEWRELRPIIDQDKCTSCGICELYCPDMAARKVDDRFEIDLDYCKGCGICADECPVDAIEMVREGK